MFYIPFQEVSIMKIKLLIICLLISGLISCGQSDDKSSQIDNPPQTPDKNSPTEITVTTSDSLRLTAWFSPSPDSGRAPLIVMLHMLNKTHESYFPFIDSLKAFFEKDTLAEGKMFPHLLNLDLRGHGRSIIRAGDSLHFGSMGDENFYRIPEDAVVMIKEVLDNYHEIIDTSRITVIGASIGANSAIMLTEFIPYVNKVVMLSPGLDYHSLKPSDAFRDFAGKTFIVTTRGDKYSHETVQRLAALKQKNWLLKIYPRGGHGTDIINQYRIAMNDMINWIVEE